MPVHLLIVDISAWAVNGIQLSLAHAFSALLTRTQTLPCNLPSRAQDIRMMVQELNLRRQRTDEDTVDDALGSEEIEVDHRP